MDLNNGKVSGKNSVDCYRVAEQGRGWEEKIGLPGWVDISDNWKNRCSPVWGFKQSVKYREIGKVSGEKYRLVW